MSSHTYPLIPSLPSGYDISPNRTLWSIVLPSGAVKSLKDAGVKVLGWQGGGMAPLANVSTPYALIGGALYQRTVPQVRTFTLSCVVQAETLAQVLRVKKTLESWVAPDNSTQTAPQLKLRCQLTDECGNYVGTTLEMPCYYAGGLQGDTNNRHGEQFAWQFIEMLPPSITELTTNTPSLSFNQSLSIGDIAQRSATGVWSNLAGGDGIGNGILAVCYDASGNLYAGGTFNTIGALTVNNIGMWNGSAWAKLGASGTGADKSTNNVNVIRVGPDSKVYVGGKFTTMGGVTCNNIAVWSGAAWAALGATPGTDGEIWDLTWDLTGNLIVAGGFTHAGGSAITGIAKWNGAAWSAVGAPAGSARYVVVGKDGSIYATAVTADKMSKWNGSSWSTVVTVTGGSAIIETAALALDGTIIFSGTFTAANGVSAANIARWNGSGVQPLGPGLNNIVWWLYVDQSNGNLYASGTFTATGDGLLPFPGSVARWNGTTWVYFDLIPNSPGTSSVRAFAKSSGGSFAFAGTSMDGTVTLSATTTVNNTGTAYARPGIAITGPGTLYAIINNTTGKALYFNAYTILAGETVALDLNPLNSTFGFNSSFFGNVMGKILTGSDFATWALAPGNNSISVLMSNTTGATGIVCSYKNTHWSFNAGA